MSKKIQIAIDGNEANRLQRLGSNVYAFEILRALHKITASKKNLQISVLLSCPPVKDLPPARKNWQYQVITPRRLWTQFALPIHLFLHKSEYHVFFTPGHYAPRLSSVPYVSSVMDLAFLKFPEQFEQRDLIQLKHWTKSSVKKAHKIVAISEFTKQDLITTYNLKPEKIIVAPPSITQVENPASAKEVGKFFKLHKIKTPYFLYLGTLQPRKNLLRVIEAFEKLILRFSSQSLKKKRSKVKKKLPQLVLAGKVGWKAQDILDRVKKSPVKNRIILPGFIPDEMKPALYSRATANILLGLYEGFGIPPLEALHYNCLPIVSKTSSLPEVVGDAGLKVDPYKQKAISQALEKAFKLTLKQKQEYTRQTQTQIKKFSWKKSAQLILKNLVEIAQETQK